MSMNKIIKTIKEKFKKFKWKVLVNQLIKYKPELKFENIKTFSKWLVERDSTSATFKCTNCNFEYIDADPAAQCDYKYCPMCGSVLEGFIEEKESLLRILYALSSHSVTFVLKEWQGKISLGWKFHYKKDGNQYGDYAIIEYDSSGDDIGEAIKVLFTQMCSTLEALNEGGECNEQL